MGGSYIQCSECGKRALKVATRCPGCGREFPPKAEQHNVFHIDLGRILPLVALAGALVAGAALIMLAVRRESREPAAEETSSVAAAVRFDTTRVAAEPAAPATETLVARSWTHVRNRRTVKGEIAAVLLPGDTVVVDSLERGWWRVALEGEVMGYAHESTLTKP
jgi:hypothetical protein